jgi:hypothetical protein
MRKRPSVRRLVGRIRKRVSGPDPRVGEAFLPEHYEAAGDWLEICEQAFKLLGAGVVQSWEIALAELARALDGPLPQAQSAELVERWSDALVGLEQPVQTLVRVVPRTVGRGLTAAKRSGRLADLTAPLEEKLAALPDKVAEGWAGTGEHLAPMFAALGDARGLSAAFARGGPSLHQALATSAATFSAAAAALPDAPALPRALFEMVDGYQGASLQAFEFTIAGQQRLLLDAIRRLEGAQ